MLKEMIEKIESLCVPSFREADGRLYSSRPLSMMAPPSSDCLELLTLTGLADLVRAKVNDLDVANWMLHVDDHLSVTLRSRVVNSYAMRSELAMASCAASKVFQFGVWMPREEFVISLQSMFVQQGAVLHALRLASALEVSAVALSEDDGISQRTTVKQGIALKESVTVKGRVVLQPFRTFREVEQPSSEFVFRLRSKEGMVPECALFEADGGKWKLDAVLQIKQWLQAQELGLPVIA